MEQDRSVNARPSAARSMRRRWTLAGGCLAMLGGLVAAADGVRNAGTAGADEDRHAVSRARFLMGTRLSIEIPAPAGPAIFEAAFDEVERLEEVMSNWRETSEVTALNRSASAAPFRCSVDLFAAVAASLRLAEGTEGAFDPTVEPMVKRLRLRSADGRVPDGPATAGEDDAAPEAPVGWRHVHLDPLGLTVWFDAPGIGIDLGGIGKGIALDAAARVLRDHGVRSALLDFGGQALALGAPPGTSGWRLGIALPEDREASMAVVVLKDASLAGSGNGERAVKGPGGRVGHILDPGTGAPARFSGTVTVAAEDGTTADALSTALFVMGPDAGVRWADRRSVAVLYAWVEEDGALRIRGSSAFARLEAKGVTRRAAGEVPNAESRCVGRTNEEAQVHEGRTR
jgi:thiamine biosynthesis lipoprotein